MIYNQTVTWTAFAILAMFKSSLGLLTTKEEEIVVILEEEEEEIVVLTSAGHSEEEFVGLRHCGELSCIARVFVRLRHFSRKFHFDLDLVLSHFLSLHAYK